MARLSPILGQATGVTAVRGEGVYLYGQDGRRYLDFTSGIGVLNTGHSHPKVVEAVRRQASQLIHAQYQIVLHPGLLELAERLGDVLPAALDTVFFSNAGSEAVEAALRLARHATGRTNVVVFQGSFHGRTIGALSMTTSKTAYRAGLQPLMGGVFVAPFPYSYRYGWDEEETTAFCLRELDYLLGTQTAPDETAALFIEPVLGEGGYVPATRGFLAGLRERCDHHGILLVMDEVQAGFGRTGRFWGHQHDEVPPDLLVAGKGLASGLPLSALAAPGELMAKGRPGSQGGTYGGNALSCAAALATLEVIEEEGLVANAARLGSYLHSALEELAAKFPAIGEVRGRGLMLATEISGEDRAPDAAAARRVLEACEAEGLLLLACGPFGNVVRWAPPLIVTEEQLDQAAAIFAGALGSATG
ncbi:MAG: aspartate aminotransferase family protein [Acidimicrobiia bacterium]